MSILTTWFIFDCFSNEKDSWRWTLDLSSKFSVKSLMGDLLHKGGMTPKPLYTEIWKDSYPKKIKSFLWELSHGGINTA